MLSFVSAVSALDTELAKDSVIDNVSNCPCAEVYGMLIATFRMSVVLIVYDRPLLTR